MSREKERRKLTEYAAPPLVKPFAMTGKALDFTFRIPDSHPSLGQAAVLIFPAVHPKLFADQPESSQYFNDSPSAPKL